MAELEWLHRSKVPKFAEDNGKCVSEFKKIFR